jgi:RNA polymerase sigma-70 factor, ECF subfamily
MPVRSAGWAGAGRVARVSEAELGVLLPAAQDGEAWALQALYEALAPQVHGYLRARGSAEPEDLTSEVFLAVFPRLGTVTGGPAGLRTLVFSVAHARLVDELRRRSRRTPTVPYDAETDDRTSASAEEEALELVATDDVRAVIDALPDDQRDVLLLRLVSDLTVDQVAIVIGRTPGAVKQLQRRGLLALRERAAQAAYPLSGHGR